MLTRSTGKRTSVERARQFRLEETQRGLAARRVKGGIRVMTMAGGHAQVGIIGRRTRGGASCPSSSTSSTDSVSSTNPTAARAALAALTALAAPPAPAGQAGAGTQGTGGTGDSSDSRDSRRANNTSDRRTARTARSARSARIARISGIQRGARANAAPAASARPSSTIRHKGNKEDTEYKDDEAYAGHTARPGEFRRVSHVRLSGQATGRLAGMSYAPWRQAQARHRRYLGNVEGACRLKAASISAVRGRAVCAAWGRWHRRRDPVRAG